MASHLSSLGLPVGSEAEFWDLAQRVGPLATAIPVDPGAYFHWRDGSGAELWLQVTGEDQFVGMTPHYTGESVVPVTITQRTAAPDGSPFDGTLICDTGITTFQADAPDFRRLDQFPHQAEVELQVAAFAHEIEIFDSETEFTEVQTEAAATGSAALRLPYFGADNSVPQNASTNGLPETRAVFTGTILQSEERTNSLTGRRFYWMLVETVGGTFDVVADATLLAGGAPLVGGIVSGSFWLSARVRA